MKIRRIYQGDDTLQTEVQADGGDWEPATPRSALGYDSPFTINGEVAARPHTAGSRFGLGDMLAHASASEQVIPGEMFSIGALSAGSGMEISRWLGHGDTLELDLPGIGHIAHQIK